MELRRTTLIAENTGSMAPGGYASAMGSYGNSMIPQDPRKMAERRANAQRRRERLREIASDWYNPSAVNPARGSAASAPRASSR